MRTRITSSRSRSAGRRPSSTYTFGQNEDECIGAVSLTPDIAEEFARALLKAAATVRDMQAPKPLSD